MDVIMLNLPPMISYPPESAHLPYSTEPSIALYIHDPCICSKTTQPQECEHWERTFDNGINRLKDGLYSICSHTGCFNVYIECGLPITNTLFYD